MNLKVVVLGDSISDTGIAPLGYVLSPGCTSASQVWSSIVQASLVAAHPEHAFTFVNAASSGKTISWFATEPQLTDRLISQHADIFLVELGINDAYTEVNSPPYDMTPRIAALFDALDAQVGVNTGWPSRVVVCSFVKPDDTKTPTITSTNAAPRNTEWMTMATARGYRTVNLWDAAVATITDGIHPSVAGMQTIASTAQPVVEQTVNALAYSPRVRSTAGAWTPLTPESRNNAAAWIDAAPKTRTTSGTWV